MGWLAASGSMQSFGNNISSIESSLSVQKLAKQRKTNPK
jgi:hypothetical protein